MSANVSNTRGGKKAARRGKNGEESNWNQFARGSAAKATAKEIPPSTQATRMAVRKFSYHSDHMETFTQESLRWQVPSIDIFCSATLPIVVI